MNNSAVLNPDWELCLELMRQEMKPALGCTEPIAVALCAARAAEALPASAEITELDVSVSRNILKNAMGVIIPGTDLYGVDYAAALGAAGGDSSRKLEVLSSYTPDDLDKAVSLVKSKKVHVSLDPTDEPLYIRISCHAGEHCSCAVISGAHDKFIHLECDKMVLLDVAPEPAEETEEPEGLTRLSLRKIYDFAMNVPIEKLGLAEEAVRLNTEISEDGLSVPYGLQTGRTIQARLNRSPLEASVAEKARMRTLAAIDARMCGSKLPVMSNSGSGNQGVTATLPVWSVAHDLGIDHETMIRAVAYSHMTSIYIKEHLDRLSALCGAIVAAMGASSAAALLMGGGFDAAERTIVNMIANVTGLICDGAKSTCALKVSTALQAGFSSMYLALDGIRPTAAEGIVSESAEECIDNLGRLTRQGMKQTDRTILDIMIEK